MKPTFLGDARATATPPPAPRPEPVPLHAAIVDSVTAATADAEPNLSASSTQLATQLQGVLNSASEAEPGLSDYSASVRELKASELGSEHAARAVRLSHALASEVGTEQARVNKMLNTPVTAATLLGGRVLDDLGLERVKLIMARIVELGQSTKGTSGQLALARRASSGDEELLLSFDSLHAIHRDAVNRQLPQDGQLDHVRRSYRRAVTPKLAASETALAEIGVRITSNLGSLIGAIGDRLGVDSSTRTEAASVTNMLRPHGGSGEPSA